MFIHSLVSLFVLFFRVFVLFFGNLLLLFGQFGRISYICSAVRVAGNTEE